MILFHPWQGRGPDKDNPSNININDALGEYSLTLIDSLGTLAIMGTYELRACMSAIVGTYDHVC